MNGLEKVNGNVDMLQVMERKFLKIYKQLPQLWNPNHPDYNNRHKRNAGYDSLLPIFRTCMPKATRLHIRQKINIFRSCYRKELRKHLASRSIDDDGKVVYSYIPANWKFRMMRFLDSGENVDNDIDDNIDNNELDTYPEYEDEQELEFQDAAEVESGNEEPDTSKIHISPLFVEEDKPERRKRSWNTNHHSFNGEDERELTNLERELNAVGSNVTCKLQRMKAEQRYHAELLINKVLIKGLKEQLTDETDFTDSWHSEVLVNINAQKSDAKVETTEEQHVLKLS